MIVLKLKDLKIEILKKIEEIDKYRYNIKTVNKNELLDILDIINNDIEKLYDLCDYYYCNNNNNNENNHTKPNNNQYNYNIPILSASYEYILNFLGISSIKDNCQEENCNNDDNDDNDDNECSCKYHKILKKILDEMMFSVVNIKNGHIENYLILYHNLDILKLNLF